MAEGWGDQGRLLQGDHAEVFHLGVRGTGGYSPAGGGLVKGDASWRYGVRPPLQKQKVGAEGSGDPNPGRRVGGL